MGGSLEELTAIFPLRHSGYDKSGRPVFFKVVWLVKKVAGGTLRQRGVVLFWGAGGLREETCPKTF